jgi:hypothetical protein
LLLLSRLGSWPYPKHKTWLKTTWKRQTDALAYLALSSATQKKNQN